MKTIGILGGIGPSASASMYSRVVRYMQTAYKAWDDADFPKIMVYSTSLQGFDETGIVDPEATKAGLVYAVQKLEAMGSDLVLVACNTVHYFDKEMQAALTVPLVHMVNEVCADTKRRGFKKVAIACSKSTRDLGLYSNGLLSLGIEAVVTTDKEQATVNAAIKDVMAGTQGSHTIYGLTQVFTRFKNDGAEAVILGCTELPLAITQSDSELLILDANDIVVRQAVKFAIE